MLASSVGPQVLDAEAARNHCRLNTRLKHAESVAFERQRVSLRPLGVLAGDFADEFVSPKPFWRIGPHTVCED